MVKPSVLKDGGGKYCGFECYRESMKGRVGYWLGKKQPQEMVRKRTETLGSEDKNPRWKGENVSYAGLHQWVYRHLGKPDQCEHCRTHGLKGHQIHWANKSGEYRRDLTDWLRLCVRCHKQYDGQVTRN